MKQNLIEIIDEDIKILFETLAHFKKMSVKGIDNENSKYLRKCKQDFIEKTLKDIDWMINFRSEEIKK